MRLIETSKKVRNAFSKIKMKMFLITVKNYYLIQTILQLQKDKSIFISTGNQYFRISTAKPFKFRLTLMIKKHKNHRMEKVSFVIALSLAPQIQNPSHKE